MRLIGYRLPIVVRLSESTTYSEERYRLGKLSTWKVERQLFTTGTTGSQAPAWEPNVWQAPACRSADNFQATLIFARQSLHGSAFPGVSLGTSVLRGGDQREMSDFWRNPLPHLLMMRS
ncbi:hypothetical protein [Stieleria varia]|uniref:Uncharacterized protein n=1 Tax=Stieleria varia TaxID=2528005 RepID=A0A5C6B5Q8_9BACT|nr:hypothetical protein [Stieleria varia]TWU05834.1 hypothetical protein Pla52n_15490 [Stieleria varia]